MKVGFVHVLRLDTFVDDSSCGLYTDYCQNSNHAAVVQNYHIILVVGTHSSCFSGNLDLFQKSHPD